MRVGGDFFSHRLDRTRPLWEMVLVEGLQDGRWALATKTHHCLVNGVGSVSVADVLLDPDGPGTRSDEPAPDESEPAPWRSLVPGPPAAIAQVVQSGAHVASAGVHAALHPRDALARSRSLVELLLRDEVIAASASSINVPIGPTRHFEIVRDDLAELKTVGRRLGGSFNDVVLAACAAGLRALLLERGEEPPARGLRAMVPMNLRDASEHLALGNRITSLFVNLPVAEADATTRLRAIAAETRRLKESGAGVGATTMLDVAALAPPVVHAVLARSLYARRLFNVTITNVPGSAVPLRLLGARLREVHPIVPLAAEHAVGVATLSYDGRVVIGVSGDPAVAPDLGLLTDGIRDGLAELRAAAAPSPPARRAAPRPGSAARA